jgi:hypothetical protein
VIGDYGNGSQKETDVSDMINTWNVEFIITLGDNNYDVGSQSTIDDHIGKDYNQWIYPYVGDIEGGGSPDSVNRFFPSLGNHDWGTPGAIPYLNYFVLPGNDFINSSENERYYDFVWDNIHFFAIDSDTHEPEGYKSSSVQATWLQNELTNCDQTHTHWRIVYFHHAPYSSEKQVTDLRWDFEGWGAHTVLAGHAHTYERVKVGNIRYFVNGLGGKSPRSFGNIINGSEARFNGDNGAQLVTVTETEMTLEFWSIGTQTNNVPQLVDSYTDYSEVVNVEVSVPSNYYLSQNYPNPFNPTTKIKYSIPTESIVSIKVFDILGNEIRSLVSEKQEQGNYEIDFDGRDLVSGIYLYKIQTGTFSQVKKMLILK